MKTPKLILLNGFAASGKTTLSKRYIAGHPLALAIEGDQIISMMGEWRSHESEAREIVFQHTLTLAKSHLKAGYDVVLPYLLTNSSHGDSFKALAEEVGAEFYEIFLAVEREDAIERLLSRGVWGEEGSPTLSSNDLPEINELYDAMESALQDRNEVIKIPVTLDAIDETYEALIKALS